MGVENKKQLLNLHAFLRLHVKHIATGSWPCNNLAAKSVNIFFTILDTGDDTSSFIRDTGSGTILPVQKNNSYFLPCNRMLHWHLSPAIKFISIHFNMEYYYGFDIFQNYPQCLLWRNSRWQEHLLEIINDLQTTPALFKLNGVLYDLVGEIYSRNKLSTDLDIVHYDRYKSVIEFVRKHGDASTRVEDLAKLMDQRSNVFSRNFTRELGITPKAFLVNALLRKASDLLRLPGKSVKQTACDLKFSSEYYFSNFFKKNTGQSPREFQQQSFMNDRK